MRPRRVLESLEPYVPGKRVAGGIKLSSNENPLGPSPHAVEALRAATVGPEAELHRYPDGGMHALREAIARRWGVEPEMVIAGNGSDEIMVMIAGAFIEPGTNAVTGAHTFSQYTFATRVFGGEVRTASMPDGRFNLNDIRARIDLHTRVVWLCSPNNPTGAIIGRDDLVSLLVDLPDDVVVVIDEAYGEFAENDAYPDTIELVRRHPNLIRLRTFSKIYGLAALRVGYGIAQPRLVATIGKLRQPFNVGSAAQAAATAALGDEEFVVRSLTSNRTERARLVRFLDDAQIAYLPSEANFVCARLPDAASLVASLAAEGITIRPLASFGLPDHVRISVGTPAEMDAFYAAFERVLGGVRAPR